MDSGSRTGPTTTPEKNANQQNPFHILALSGGGYKGLFTAQIAHLIEEETGQPFGSHFDLICGTSIGGILALALATREIAASVLVEMLQQHGTEVFKPMRPHPLNIPARWLIERTGLRWKRGLAASKHGNLALKEQLEAIFGDRRIGDLKSRVLITTANWSKGGPQFFKTPHSDGLFRDTQQRLVDVAMATSAAPIYLPSYEFENQTFVDGGLVGNAPAIFGLHEAENFVSAAKNADIKVLAIGTLSKKVTADPSKPLDKGLLSWGSGLFDFMMACQEQVTHHILCQKLGDNYQKIDENPSEEQSQHLRLDNAEKPATKALLALAGTTFQSEFNRIRPYTEHHAPTQAFVTP
jgi:patatin-like phospholipase/acyl hydrolase